MHTIAGHSNSHSHSHSHSNLILIPILHKKKIPLTQIFIDKSNTSSNGKKKTKLEVRHQRDNHRIHRNSPCIWNKYLIIKYIKEERS